MGASRPEPRRPFRGTALGALVRALALAPCFLPPGLQAQVLAEPRLRGRIEADSTFPGGTVVLHEVGRDTAGEVDSVRVDAGGAFTFALPSVPGGGPEVYFASIRHQGVLYFGAPVGTAAQLDSVYVIEVFDTAAAPREAAGVPLAVRYLLLDPIPEGQGSGWRVTDLMQIENPGSRTLVAAQGPVWRYPLPANAADVQLGQSDVAPGALNVVGDTVRVSMPLPPGERQIVLRYRVAGFPLVFPAPGLTEHVEVLIREPAPFLEVTPLQGAEAVEMEPGVTYRHFASARLEDTSIRIAEGRPPRGLPVRTMGVATALLLALAGLWAYLRRAPGSPSPAAALLPGSLAERRDALVLDIARLDEARERGDLDEATWRERRGVLLERLRALGPGAA